MGGLAIDERIQRIRTAIGKGGPQDHHHACSLAQTVLQDTVGGGHVLVRTTAEALQSGAWQRTKAAAEAVVDLYEEGVLSNPTLRIAHEVEETFLDIAEVQAKEAEKATDAGRKAMLLGISAFLAGAVLEDAMRRLCDANGIPYDAQKTSLSKLQAALYQPSKNIEIISNGENKQITAWGETRNNADHGRFDQLTQTEVVMMIMGVRALLAKHLP